MTTITITTPSGHTVHLHPMHYMLTRPEDVAEQMLFASLAAQGRDAEVRSALREAEQGQRLHMANRAWAIREQAI